MASGSVLLALESGSLLVPAFARLGRRFVAAGAVVTLALVDAAGQGVAEDTADGLTTMRIGPPDTPLICGLGRSSGTQPLRLAYALAEATKHQTFDLALVPFAGGLAHGLLMRRATGEAAGPRRVALWAETPSRCKALHQGAAPCDVSVLVADALERMTLRHADAILTPDECASDRLRSLGEPLPPLLTGWLPQRDDFPSTVAATALQADEIVFVGPLTADAGLLAFLDAVEELARDGRLGDRRVTLLGPAQEPRDAMGELIGVRALRWPFRFAVVEVASEAGLLDTLADPRRLPIVCASDLRALVLPALEAAGRPMILLREMRGGASGAMFALATEIHAALAGDIPPVALPPAADWPSLLAELQNLPIRTPAKASKPVGSVSVLMLHRHRPDRLVEARASVPTGTRFEVEAVVVDNAGEPPIRPDVIAARVLRLDPPLPPGAAYNRAAETCTTDALVFLDDDNVLTPDGLARLVDALASGWFDVVVTTLDVVDGIAASDASVGRFLFLGDAASAGLFFNGFGDTALAIRREAFLRIGGFPEPGHLAPTWDWVMLAKARAQGLRIGVLHDPAVRYARRIGESGNWLKLDRDGSRRAVLEAYGDTIDAPLVARYAQHRQAQD